MVFSPAGTAAALYDSGAGRVQILTGLPDAAAVQSDVDISALAGPVAALAVDDAGIFAFPGGGRGGNGFPLPHRHGWHLAIPGLIPQRCGAAPVG